MQQLLSTKEAKVANPIENKNTISKTSVNISLTLKKMKASSYLARGF